MSSSEWLDTLYHSKLSEFVSLPSCKCNLIYMFLNSVLTVRTELLAFGLLSHDLQMLLSALYMATPFDFIPTGEFLSLE